jgi:hypothetical protein
MTDFKDERASEARLAVWQMSVLDEDELDLFDWCVVQTDGLIATMISDAHSETKKALDAGDECAGDSWIPVDYFANRTRWGQIVYLASLVESFLTRACERLENAAGGQNILFKLDELSGEKLRKRRKFLQRYGNIDISDKIWAPIDKMVRIRNIVVHENGRLASNQSGNPDWPPGVQARDGELVLESSFVGSCRLAVRNLIDHVESERRKSPIEALNPTSP